MKRIICNITLASVITLVAYITLYSIWGAILSSIKNQELSLFMVSLMTTVAFGFILLYTSKIRKAVGEDEVVSDYKNRNYISLADDFKLVIARESKMLVCIVAIVLLCF